MSVLTKYSEYLKYFPVDLEYLLAITKDYEGLHQHNSQYYGPIKDTKKHGSYGILIQKKQNQILHIREGQWKNDKFNGKGSHYIISKPNKKEKPIIIWREGSWIINRMKGKGAIKQYNFSKSTWEIKYIGNFLNDEKDGFGIAYFDDKKNYQGYFKKGCFHGAGRLTRSDDNYQDGIFCRGQFVGDGIQRRKQQFVLYDEFRECEIYSTPNSLESYPSFYQNIVQKLCQTSLAQ